jgi:Ca2+/Na+ antiporter
MDPEMLSETTPYKELMSDATPPTLAARNAYAVLLVVLMILFVYQAITVIESDLVIEVLFYLAAGVYIVSLYYYRRGQDNTDAEDVDGAEPD